MARVIVVGAGVVGLCCAVRVLEDGHRVDVVARDLPLETTSAVAAALWYPYRARPYDRVAAWAATGYAELARLAELARVPPSPPYADAWSFVAPVVEMPVHLRWLVSRVEALGGTVTRMALPALPDQADVVVDATGLGARRMAGDPSLRPVRGQVVLVGQVGLDRWWLVGSRPPLYVVPRSRDIVVGGTDDEGEWDRRPNPAAARRVLERAVELVPDLARAPVLGHRVGLRPERPEVRLEVEQRGRVRVVHCYGHGGAGVTLAWGCAAEVAALVAG